MSKTFDKITEELQELNPKALLADGFEDALVGFVEHFNRFLACYDKEKCLRILMKRDKMTRDQAVEYFEFNVAGSWVGQHTPVFLINAKDIAR
jgi:hypothetical protein